MSRKYKLLLVNPQNRHRIGFALSVTSRYPPLSLGILAALVPDNWDIKILDENFEKFEETKDNDPDFVGITAFTSNVYRAYQIAGHYHEKGIPVILGGNHATMMPGEASQYVDVVFKGEAETVWPEVIKDFENNQLKNVYDGGRPSMNKVPIARHDLFHPSYIFTSIQTTRGCPYQCDFCSVHTFNGTKHRLRPVRNILDEIEQLPENKLLGIVDDNFYGYSIKSRNHTYELLEGMINRGIKKDWFIQASINIADDPKFLKLASKAGCREVLIGVESDNPEQLKQSNKALSVKNKPGEYRKKFKRIQSRGIAVLGAYIFGMDGDTQEDLFRRLRFIQKSGVDIIQATVLTPYPGTVLFERLQAENRIYRNQFPEDWQHYHAEEVVHYPDKMTPEELEHAMYIIWHKLYNKTAMRWLFIKSLLRLRRITPAMWSYMGNWQYRRIVFEMGGYNPDKNPDNQERKFIEPFSHQKIENKEDDS